MNSNNVPNNTNNQNDNQILGDFDILPNELIWYLLNFLDIKCLTTLLKLNTSFHTFTKDYVVNKRNPDSTQTQDFINALQRSGILITDSPFHNQIIKLSGPGVYFYITKDITDDDTINYYFYYTGDILYGSFRVKLKITDTLLKGTIVNSTLPNAIGQEFSAETTSTALLIYGHELYRALLRSDQGFLGFAVRDRSLMRLNFLCHQNDDGIYSATPHFFLYGYLGRELKNFNESLINIAPLTYKTNNPVFNWRDQRKRINKIRLFNYCNTSETINNHKNNDTHSPPAKKNRKSTDLTPKQTT